MGGGGVTCTRRLRMSPKEPRIPTPPELRRTNARHEDRRSRGPQGQARRRWRNSKQTRSGRPCLFVFGRRRSVPSGQGKDAGRETRQRLSCCFADVPAYAALAVRHDWLFLTAARVLLRDHRPDRGPPAWEWSSANADKRLTRKLPGTSHGSHARRRTGGGRCAQMGSLQQQLTQKFREKNSGTSA